MTKKGQNNMGKNNPKKRQRTEFAKWESIMAKLENELKKEREAHKKEYKAKEKNNVQGEYEDEQ